MSGFRPFLRKAAYRSGVLGLARARARSTLTVVMLHRVLNPADPDFAAADPTYTLPLPVFVHLLEFLQRHYAIVGLADVVAAHDRAKPLPAHAVLVTFDDGWADNLSYAAPVLQSLAIPAVVFAAAEAVLSPDQAWWQEQVFAAGRGGYLMRWLSQCGADGALPASATADAESTALDVVVGLAAMDATTRERLLRSLPAVACSRRMMLTMEELSRLPRFGIDVGLHGHRHLPLTCVADVEAELASARAAIDPVGGRTLPGTVLGCPHGRYDTRVIEGARKVGIKLIFTSDAWLNATEGGLLRQDGILGRINVVARHIADRAGRFDPSAAARWLWDREIH